MAEECKVYEIEVPDASAYYWDFVDKYVTDDADKQYVLPMSELRPSVKDLLKWLEESGELSKEEEEALVKVWELAKNLREGGYSYYDVYIRTFCLLGGYGTALVLKDKGDVMAWPVIFGLDPSTIEKIRTEISNYVSEIERALRSIQDERKNTEFKYHCYYLKDWHPEECLEEARRILSGQNVVPA